MNNVLVTGGCGFVGRHLVRRLLADGYNVWVVDNLSTGRHPDEWLGSEWNSSVLTAGFVEYKRQKQAFSFLNEDALAFFSKQMGIVRDVVQISLPRFEQVYHLASVVGGRAVIEGDPMAVAIDLAIDAAFFRWVVGNKEKVGRVLYASSSAAYPVHLQTEEGHVALSEDMISFDKNLGMPDMTYGWSKLSGEYLSVIAAEKYGIPVSVVRPFSGYGGDQDQSYPIPAIARRVALREDPLIVWGTGEQGRDFVHIDDCIEALLLANEKVSDGGGVNIGTGILTSFKEVASIFARLEGYKPEVKPLIGKPEGVQSRYCDPENMEKRLGWKPSISREEGFMNVLKEQKILIEEAKKATQESL